MQYAQTWGQAQAKLTVLYPSAAERGRIRNKLLDLDEAKALMYFWDTDEAVKSTLDTGLREGKETVE